MRITGSAYRLVYSRVSGLLSSVWSYLVSSVSLVDFDSGVDLVHEQRGGHVSHCACTKFICSYVVTFKCSYVVTFICSYVVTFICSYVRDVLGTRVYPCP